MNNTNIAKLIFSAFIFTLLVSGTSFATSRNLLPRFPEIILEKGFSENFEVTDCIAKVRIVDDTAQATLKVTLKNCSDKTIKSSAKFRILYPTSVNQIRIKVNDKAINYDRNSPRHIFELGKNESITFKLSAKTDINYSIDSVREALRKQNEEHQAKGKKFDLSGLMKLFEREKFGKRFLIGPLVSKWGIFPLNFSKVDLEVIVPSDFTIVSQAADKWNKRNKNRESTYTYSDSEGFDGTVFLPETDKEEFVKTQKILTSSEFMH
ncbi:MAG: hypothetical protein Kow0029_08130 [Candidatus Rifleibacteriota bacterium]